MDRVIVYPGSVPMDTDLLRSGVYAKEGIGRLSEMLFGQGAVSARGLVCTPSASGLSVTIGPGSIVAPGVVDATSFGGAGGGLAADPTPLACQYINPQVQTVAVSSTGATLTVFAVCSERDIDPAVLPFYNAANPTQTQAGVGNAGGNLPTCRTGSLSFVIGTSAPAAPSGGAVVALYTFTVAAGVSTLAGVVPTAGRVFWPTIPELATMTLLQAATTPMALASSSGPLTVPAWASRVELRAIGGGGGGSTSNAMTPADGSFSGSGGGAGGDAWGLYAVNPASTGTLTLTIGAGGGQQETGGATVVSYGGATLLQAGGGAGGAFYSSQGSAGGDGGTASGGTIWNLTGGYGGDGQSGVGTFSGNGGNGPWGGGGRCGNIGGKDATAYGAGGGGAYSASANGTTSPGGAGYQGCVLYRFLP